MFWLYSLWLGSLSMATNRTLIGQKQETHPFTCSVQTLQLHYHGFPAWDIISSHLCDEKVLHFLHKSILVWSLCALFFTDLLECYYALCLLPFSLLVFACSQQQQEQSVITANANTDNPCCSFFFFLQIPSWEWLHLLSLFPMDWFSVTEHRAGV